MVRNLYDRRASQLYRKPSEGLAWRHCSPRHKKNSQCIQICTNNVLTGSRIKFQYFEIRGLVWRMSRQRRRQKCFLAVPPSPPEMDGYLEHAHLVLSDFYLSASGRIATIDGHHLQCIRIANVVVAYNVTTVSRRHTDTWAPIRNILK